MQKRPKKCISHMDEYLASRALFRKTMARDASSLFRAVSEQLYHSQSYHQKIRQDCANFMIANRCKFEPFVEGSFDKYLERLEDPKEMVGQLEIKALSLLYRLRFVIYLYPGQPPNVITEDGFTDKVMLCCSNTGHYDIVYPRSYLTSAAICQSILYELLYTRVFGVDEAELHQAMDAFQDRRYRNRLSAISHGDMSYELPEDRSHKEEAEAGGAGAAAEDKARAGTDDSKPPAEPSSSTLILPYKVLKSLDTILYRNVEFDVWLDSCRERQYFCNLCCLKTDYMEFAAREYFVGDQCQVRLEPKGKYYKAFIQDVGTLAVTVFIEELGEKHFVPLTNVKPTGSLMASVVIATVTSGRLKAAGGCCPCPHLTSKPPCPPSSSRPVLLSPPPSVSGATRAAGSRPTHPPHLRRPTPTRPTPTTTPPPTQDASLHDPGFQSPVVSTAAEPVTSLAVEEGGAAESPTDGQQGQAVAPPPKLGAPPPPPPASSYWVQRGPGPLPPTSTVEDQTDYSEFYIYKAQDPGFQSPVVSTAAEPVTSLAVEEGGAAESPTDGQQGQAVAPPPKLGAPPPPPPASSYWVQRGPGPLPPTSTVEDQTDYSEFYIYKAQDPGFQSPVVSTAAEPVTSLVVKPSAVICFCPSSSSFSPSSSSSHTPLASHLPVPAHSQPRTVAMAMPATPPWLVNELGEPLCTVVAPPSYSYHPNGSDLPGGPALSLEVSSPTSSSISRVPTGSAPPPLLYPGQPFPPPPSGLPLPYEAPRPPYLPAPSPLPPPPPHPHFPHHSSYHTYLPPAQWGAFPPGGPAHGTHPRVYQPATNPTHMVGYITAPPPHHSATHYLPPSM
ncbi:OTU domain-containing protein 4-like [Myripristis murdjan]|uniref:OTU domain-containing protein 4-like n=1 Tax=Myripristis murdjan TaxID=586833 RepID=UPI001175DBA1|nr:OTU domain-containing protein 4-like [Myripristis murdjan]